MASNKRPASTEYRTLPEVFQELQESRYQYEQQNEKIRQKYYTKQSTRKWLKPVAVSCISISSLMVVILVALSFHSSFAQDVSASLDEPIVREDVSVEVNRHRLNPHNIITSNAAFEVMKEQVTEERDIPFEILHTQRSILPKNEEVVLQDGIPGKKDVTVVKSYENGEFIEEIILKEEKKQDYLPQIIDVGTSEYLARIKAHLGDTLYLSSSSKLYEKPDDSSTELTDVKLYFDVKLLDLPSEEWCKVSFDGEEGYIPSKSLTSAAVSPGMPEKCRIQRMVVKLDKEMPLNQPSGFTLKDYKKIFTGLSKDTKNIFSTNYEAFYNVEKNYGINGIFLASLAIHESAWGTSQIAEEKKNLFGYGSYDATPYESSYEFETYQEGIDLVARVMVKYYINPPGTKIFENQKAAATYYHGSRVEDVNQRYASDENWHTKVYSYMEMLYKRLQ